MVDIEELTKEALMLGGATIEYKEAWDAHLVKVCSKMFMLLYTNKEGEINLSLKCNPEWAVELRDKYNSVTAGYHLNKKHWNTISLQEEIPQEIMRQMIIHSYEMVVEGLTKKQKMELSSLKQ